MTGSSTAPLLTPSRLVSLPSGLSLHVMLQGPEEGPAIVLLHGLGDSWRSFELVLPHLDPDRRVVTVSLRGHGVSDRPDRGYAPADMAGDIVALLTALDLSDVTLVGHSYGSFVAQIVAQRDLRVTGLVLVGSAPGGVEPGLRAELAEAFDVLTDPIDPVFVRAFQSSTAHRALPPAFLHAMCVELGQVPVRVLQEMIHSLDGTGVEPGLAALATPTLVVWGDRDGLFTRADQDRLVAQIAGARLVVYEETGHAPHWEQPQRFAEDLLAFASSWGG